MLGSVWSATTEVTAPKRRLAAVGQPGAAFVKALPSARRPRPALVLGAFFVSLYLLTMGGHLDSPDEELMFQVTRSLVERGTLNVSRPDTPDVLVQTGIDGQSYAHYGPVSSILSMPFYASGRAAAGLMAPRYADVVERFAVGLRDPLTAAATCVLLYILAVELGFSTRSGVLLALA
jgi:hypothetical protein